MYWVWIRIAAALTALTGVIAGFIVNVDRAARLGQNLGAVLANYFSLFTIISSLLSVVVLVAAATWAASASGTPPSRCASLGMAAVAGPVILLGLVYNALLRGLPSEAALGGLAGIALLDSYAIDVLHVVMPIYFVLDLLLAPRRRGLPWWSLGVIVGYPLAWTAYTMIRGELVANPDGTTPGGYPYPFLDPHGAGGYGTALTYIGAILGAFVVIGVAMIMIGRYREKRAATRSSAAPTAGRLAH